MYDEPNFCPSCGAEMKAWWGDIYECPNCGNMTEIIEEDEK
ncbi:phage terminase large subunit family protein [Listeria booriae]|nr:phage terminase large subunit family protein [Listeria booriae]